MSTINLGEVYYLCYALWEKIELTHSERMLRGEPFQLLSLSPVVEGYVRPLCLKATFR